MDFIDDVNLMPTLRRSISDILPQLSNLINPPVGGPIDFDHINRIALGDFFTGGALIAGVNLGPLFTVQGLCQNPGRGRFTHSSRSREQEGMSHSFLGDGVLKRLSDGTLSDNILKDLGSLLSGQN